MNNEMLDKALDWDDEVQENEYEAIPEGVYSFTVTKFERGNHSGSKNLPACKKATLTLELKDNSGKRVGQVIHTLYLHTKCKGFLSQFFIAIGETVTDGSVKMNWAHVPGATGKCEIFIDKYEGNEYSKVKRFLKPEKNSAPSSYGDF